MCTEFPIFLEQEKEKRVQIFNLFFKDSFYVYEMTFCKIKEEKTVMYPLILPVPALLELRLHQVQQTEDEPLPPPLQVHGLLMST
jgi:hypothetical protein